ncbi:hypothetical protein [Bacteroides stercoris]|uniref:hypothetical protein n=1 Tax=Bacteroides stercoris TaxID=46506 RepID=UPI00373FCE97
MFHEHKERYGYPRVTTEMHNRSFMLNRLTSDLWLKSQIRGQSENPLGMLC